MKNTKASGRLFKSYISKVRDLIVAREDAIANVGRDGVLALCEEHMARTGQWPNDDAGEVAGLAPLPENDPFEWDDVFSAIVMGRAGFAFGTTLESICLA